MQWSRQPGPLAACPRCSHHLLWSREGDPAPPAPGGSQESVRPTRCQDLRGFQDHPPKVSSNTWGNRPLCPSSQPVRGAQGSKPQTHSLLLHSGPEGAGEAGGSDLQGTGPGGRCSEQGEEAGVHGQGEEPVPASDCRAALTPLPRGPCVRPAQVVAPLGGCPLTAPGRAAPRQLVNPVRLDGRAPGAWRGPLSAASPRLWSGEGMQGRAQGRVLLGDLAAPARPAAGRGHRPRSPRWLFCRARLSGQGSGEGGLQTPPSVGPPLASWSVWFSPLIATSAPAQGPGNQPPAAGSGWEWPQRPLPASSCP